MPIEETGVTRVWTTATKSQLSQNFSAFLKVYETSTNQISQ